MIIYVDIDDTICTIKNKMDPVDYSLSQPIIKNIEKINDYYDKGHQIIYWTARGSTTGIDWIQITENQLDLWGAKRHGLLMNKPYYDLYIDDKSINCKQWEMTLNLLENINE